ncbi:hypothetical protein DFJ74DRAFT_696569 [Hyaloraphidium curvatum]|nr:hypothetical protein DFJ74DRAFT_696569 [Hyaloraphidium curvatum]
MADADAVAVAANGTADAKPAAEHHGWKAEVSRRLGWDKVVQDEDGVDPLVNSWWLGPKGVLIVRTLITAWQVGILIAVCVTMANPTYFLTYFTNITYTALTGFLLVATYLSLRKVLSKDPNFRTLPPWAAITMKLFLPIQTPIHFVVTVVYWALLAKGFQFLSFAEHGLEFVVALIEWWFCNRCSLQWVHLVLLLAIGLSYMFLAWVFYATLPPPGSDGSVSSGYWVYSFLSWNNPVNAAYYILVLVMFNIGWGLFWLLNKYVRDKYGRRRLERIAGAANGDTEMNQAKVAPVEPAVVAAKEAA